MEKMFMYLIANHPEETLDFILTIYDWKALSYYNDANFKLKNVTRYY